MLLQSKTYSSINRVFRCDVLYCTQRFIDQWLCCTLWIIINCLLLFIIQLYQVSHRFPRSKFVSNACCQLGPKLCGANSSISNGAFVDANCWHAGKKSLKLKSHLFVCKSKIKTCDLNLNVSQYHWQSSVLYVYSFYWAFQLMLQKAALSSLLLWMDLYLDF